MTWRKWVVFTMVSILLFGTFKITLDNPAWVIGMKYPNADRKIHSVNSPDFYFWSSLARFFGVPMTDPDHYLAVHVSCHTDDLTLRDFRKVDELYVSNSSVSDISDFFDSSSKLDSVVFTDCDFSKLPQTQAIYLKDYHGKKILSYEEKKKYMQDY
ncbi:hypothetical protein [Rubritalea squalenifaciens]|nr:hypothetical protein [Rubritalea squalenifaciens]